MIRKNSKIPVRNSDLHRFWKRHLLLGKRLESGSKETRRLALSLLDIMTVCCQFALPGIHFFTQLPVPVSGSACQVFEARLPDSCAALHKKLAKLSENETQ